VCAGQLRGDSNGITRERIVRSRARRVYRRDRGAGRSFPRSRWRHAFSRRNRRHELSMQAKLLRVLQDGMITPVGSSSVEQVNVRIIAATHRDLVAMVREEKFRED